MDETLGLLYGSVRLAPYTEEWQRRFVAEAARLQAELAGHPCEIEHIGSTAVPGLSAKPILDIAAGVPPARDIQALIAPLTGLGYQYRGNAGADGGHLFVRESSPGVRTHHLHVVAFDDQQWSNYLTLRDFLRKSTGAREAYLRGKSVLAARHPDDRRSYTRGKAALIAELLAEARGRPAAIIPPAP